MARASRASSMKALAAEASQSFSTPGLVDLHVHLREPGTNSAETILSGTRAALLGGYAVIGDMPNNPGKPTWTVERLREKHALIRQSGHVMVAAHVGSQPEQDNTGELPDLAAQSLWLKLYGGATTGTHRDYEANEFRESVRVWHDAAPTQPIGFHPGEHNLKDMIALVAREFDHPLHIHHVHSREQLDLIIDAKSSGLPVTAGVTPHHLLMTSHDELSRGWYARMQPPLTNQAESEELMTALLNGNIDIIETDHAPHTIESKLAAEQSNPDGIQDPKITACYGVPGIEFAAPLMFYQAKRGAIPMERLIEAMSTRPAELLDIKISDKTKVTWDMKLYRIGEDDVQSQAGWTPFMGMLAVGMVRESKIGDSIRYSQGELTGPLGSKAVLTEPGTVI